MTPSIQSKVSITAGAASVVIWSSATSSRWHLMYGWVAWAGASAGGVIDLREEGAGSASSSFMRFMVNATGGFVPFRFDKPGMQASDKSSGLKMTFDAAGSVTAMFVGYFAGHP